MSQSENHVAATRRRLSGRRAETVRKLSEATRELLAEVEYSGLTVQNVAERAGVTRATAYIYFSSKDHLIADLYWREFRSQDEPSATGTPKARVASVMRQATMTFANPPTLARAAYHAMLSDDPDVQEIRTQVAAEMQRRLTLALAQAETDPTLLRVLDLIYTGAIMRAGTGHLSYPEVVSLIQTALDHVMPEP